MDDTVSNMPREEEKVGGVTHTEVAHSELVRSDGEHYRMTKTTFMAVIAFSWSWACVSCMNTTATTVSHQIASVGGVGDIAWISNASLIVQASLQAVMGSFGDHYGKRWLIIMGGWIGFAGGLIAGRATSVGQIIAGQALLGLSCTMVILAIPAGQEIVPSRYRPLVSVCNVIFIVAMSCTVTLGQSATVKYGVGGALEGWRYSYYLPAMMCGINSILVFLFYKPPPTRIQRETGGVSLFKSLDYVGFFLIVAGLILFNLGLVWGGNIYHWSSAHVIASLTVGVVTLLAFGIYEWKGTSTGLLDHRMFKNRNFPILLAVAFVDGILLFGYLNFVPQEVAYAFTSDAIVQVLPIIGYTITLGIGAVFSAVVLFLTKRYRVILFSALIWMSLFVGLLALVTKDRGWMIYAWPTIVGIGTGVTTVLPNILISLSVPHQLIGTAITLSGAFRTSGGVIGVTIFDTVYNNKYNAYAPGHITAAVLEAGLPASSISAILGAIFSKNTASLQDIPGMTASALSSILTASVESYLYSFKYVYIAIFPFCLLCAVMVLFLKSVDKRMNQHVESQLEKFVPANSKLDGETADV